MKTILITGGAKGIGWHVAEGLQQRGYRVFATSRHAEGLAKIQAAGMEAIQMDLADSHSIHRAVNELFERTGHTLDALFNNAAYGQPGAVEDLRRDVLRAQFEINVFGTLELTNLIIPIMRQQNHGRIIFNSSVQGFFPISYRGAYAASKHALEALVDTLRLELHDTPIHISLIEPGPITTEFRHAAYEAFQQHIHSEQSVHSQNYEKLFTHFINNRVETAYLLPPEAVYKKVLRALESNKPKARYYIGKAALLLALCKRLLPTSVIDNLARNITREEIGKN